MIRLLAAIGMTACLTAPGAVAQSKSALGEAAVAAEVGDDVEVRYTGSTILCPSRNDASVLHLAGEVAFAQTMRVERSVWQAIDKKKDARKQAMLSLHSCQWAPHGLRYRVNQKQIAGTEVYYCLQPIVSGVSRCWWVVETAASSSPFKDVQRPTEIADKVEEARQ